MDKSLPVADDWSASRKKFGYFRIAVIRPTIADWILSNLL
jgi:hypothetical protein